MILPPTAFSGNNLPFAISISPLLCDLCAGVDRVSQPVSVCASPHQAGSAEAKSVIVSPRIDNGCEPLSRSPALGRFSCQLFFTSRVTQRIQSCNQEDVKHILLIIISLTETSCAW